MSDINYPIEYKFNWNDDHSNWRLEELMPSITKANEILIKCGQISKPESFTYLGELEDFAKKLAYLYRDESIDDTTSREALLLADEFNFAINFSEYDAREEYDCLIANVKETIEGWSESFKWFYLKDLDPEWEVDPLAMLANLESSRYGLGEHWSITLDIDSIELPDGTTVYGFAPDKVQEELVEYFYYSYMQDGEVVKIAEIIKNNPANDYQTILELTEIIAENHLLDSGGLSLFNTITELSNKNLTPLFFESLKVLAKEWGEDTASLLVACDNLINEK